MAPPSVLISVFHLSSSEKRWERSIIFTFLHFFLGSKMRESKTHTHRISVNYSVEHRQTQTNAHTRCSVVSRLVIIATGRFIGRCRVARKNFYFGFFASAAAGMESLSNITERLFEREVEMTAAIPFMPNSYRIMGWVVMGWGLKMPKRYFCDIFVNLLWRNPCWI